MTTMMAARSLRAEDVAMDTLDDADLALIRDGGSESQAAFARIYERYEDNIRGLCCKRVGRNALDEVVHSVFVDAWAKLVAGHSVTHLRPWMCGVARIMCLRHRTAVARDNDRRVCMTDLENGRTDERLEFPTWEADEADDFDDDVSTIASFMQHGRKDEVIEALAEEGLLEMSARAAPRTRKRSGGSRPCKNIRPWPHASCGEPGTVGDLVCRYHDGAKNEFTAQHFRFVQFVLESMMEMAHQKTCDMDDAFVESVYRITASRKLRGSWDMLRRIRATIRGCVRWGIESGVLEEAPAIYSAAEVKKANWRRSAEDLQHSSPQWARGTLGAIAPRFYKDVLDHHGVAHGKRCRLMVDWLAHRLGDKPLRDIKAADIDSAIQSYNESGFGASSNKIFLGVVRTLFRWAVTNAMLSAQSYEALNIGSVIPNAMVSKLLLPNAEEWLRQLLSNGAILASEAAARGREVGLSIERVRNARKQIGASVRLGPGRRYYWVLDGEDKRAPSIGRSQAAWARRVDLDDDKDLAVIRQQGADQREAFDRIVRRHWRRIAGVCAKCLCGHGVHPDRIQTDLDELVQDVFVEFWMRLGVTGRDVTNVAAFLISSARRHHCKRYLRAISAKRVVIFVNKITAMSKYQREERDEQDDAIPHLADRLRMGDVETVIDAAVSGGLDRAEVARKLGRYRQAKGASKALTIAPVGSSRLMQELAGWDRSLSERGWSAKARRAHHRIIEQVCEFAGWDSAGEFTPDGIAAYLRHLGESGRTPETCKKTRCAITNFVKVASPEAFDRCFKGEWRGGVILNTQAA